MNRCENQNKLGAQPLHQTRISIKKAWKFINQNDLTKKLVQLLKFQISFHFFQCYQAVRMVMFVQFSYNYLKFSDIQRMEKTLKVSSVRIPLKIKDKIKRSSKICSALKTRFLEILQDEGTTIKHAAKHLGINYSTAKVIAKENKHLLKEKLTSYSDFQEQYLPSRERKPQVIKKQQPRCSYLTLDQEDCLSTLQNARVPPIEIISTVAWNFLEQGLPSFVSSNN